MGRLRLIVLVGMVSAEALSSLAATSSPLTINIASARRIANTAESLAYDCAWVGDTNAIYRIKENGNQILSLKGRGAQLWTKSRPGIYTLTANAYVDGVMIGEELSAEFEVVGRDLVNAEVTILDDGLVCDGRPKEPRVVVRLNGELLAEGIDYTVAYKDNIMDVGTVIISGKGKYFDEIERNFRISPAGACSLDICSGLRFANCPEKLNFDQTWIGAEGGDKYIRIMENGARITQETGVGDYAWTANDKGLYTLEYRTYLDGYKQDEVYTAQFFIGGGALTQDGISVSISPEAFAYDGQPKEPAVTVLFDGVALRKDVDYTVSYEDNVEIGTGCAIVRGIGEYADEVRKPFTIYGPMGVRALSARQRYPWNGLVDIDCIADGEPGSTYRVSFSAFDVVGGTNLPMRTVWQTGGETNVCHLVTPQNYRFAWDAGADLPDGIKFDNIKIVASASELWSNELTFSVSGYTGSSTLSGVPVLVRLSSTLAGFDYSRMAYQGSGYDLSFVSADGKTVYPHEIDTWNPSGESLVWVRLPSVAKTGTNFKMRYGNPLAPSVNAQSVWSDYAGVWHLSESASPAKDSTSHALNATTSGSLYASGVCGTARSTEVKVPNYNSLALGGTFTASGWFRSSAAITTYPKAFYRNESGWTAGGWGVEFATSATSINIVGASNTSYLKHVTVPTVVNKWVYLTFVYNGTTATCYANGASVQSGTIVAAKDNGKALSVGSGGLLSDEVRLRKGTLTADRIKADYNIIANKSFLSASAPVSRDSVVTESDSIRIDLKQDAVRESEGIEPLVYSGLWNADNNATVTIAQDGVALFEGLEGAGVKTWSVDRNGRYVLTHTTYTNGVAGKVETAVFVVEGKNEPICPEGEEPGIGVIPEGGISKYDATYVYDGEGHTINTQALYAVTLTGSTPSFSFSLDGETGWQNDPFVCTNVGEYVMWYKITALGYIDFKHQAKLVILEAPKIGNAVARQRYPWNGLVDVDFDLSCELETAEIPLTLIVHDTVGGTNLPCRTLFVDGVAAEKIQVQGGHHRVTWDADADLPDGFECDRVTVEVKVK